MLRRIVAGVAGLALSLGLWTAPAAGAGTPAAGSLPHVFWIMMENEGYSSAIAQPYTQSLMKQFGYTTDLYATRHPSLPNYLALTSGHALTYYDWPPPDFTVPNIVDQLSTAGIPWDVYAESLPSVGYLGGDVGPYRQHHVPFVYYTDFRNNQQRTTHLQPLHDLLPLLAGPASAVPNYVWITPNVQSDGGATGGAYADHWLSQFVPQILASPAWQDGGVLIVTWDEYPHQPPNGGHVLSLLISKHIAAGPISGLYSDYSLLRSLEQAWGLPYLGHAATAAPIPQLTQALRPAATAPRCSTSHVDQSVVGSSTATVTDSSGRLIVTGLGGTGGVEAALYGGGCTAAWVLPYGSGHSPSTFMGLQLSYCGFGDFTIQWQTAAGILHAMPAQTYDAGTGCVSSTVSTTSTPSLSDFQLS